MASLGSPQGGGPAPITVRVREDKGKMGDMQVRVTGVRGEKQDDEYEGPWGAKGPLWFFARLMTFITCVAIISTRSWARGGKYRIDIDYQFENLGNGKSSERVFLERSEVGIVSACYKGWSASSRVGPLAAEQCDYVFSGMKWDEDAMLVALIFAVLFILVLSYRLSYEATELFFPGFLPVCFFLPSSQRVLRHVCWVFMLIPWLAFLIGWSNDEFDFISLEYDEVTDLWWGWWTWLILWIFWFIKVVLIEVGFI
eukprot:Rhum_TRINITY_DN16604_c0_g1::Rhum_TRINITY_DN16604_c0_g1_i1::g.163812::m.163812